LGAAVYVYLPGVAAVLSGPFAGQLVGFFTVTLPVTLYFAVQESWPTEGSWGKRRFHLRVAAVDGRRVRFGRALLRTALKFFPWELAHTCVWQFWYGNPESAPWIQAGLILVLALVGANLLSVALSPRRQALYDRLSGTMVVRERG